MLLLLSLILELLYQETDLKMTLGKCVKYLLTGVAGMGLYYGLLLVCLKVTGTTLLDYQGVGDAAALKSIDIAGALYVIKTSFFSYFFDFSQGVHVFGLINCALLLLTVALYLRDIIQNKLPIGKILLLCVCVILLPIGASVLAFINSSIDYHNLMKMGFVVFYLFLILQYERTDCGCVKCSAIKSWAILGLFAV